MNVDIFIKTCWKDLKWFDWCVKSIERYARLFRSVVVVVDERVTLNTAAIGGGFNIRTCEVPRNDRARDGFRDQKTLEYFWASAIKATWTDYTDADAVVWIDSDEMFLRPITPAFWFTPDGRPIWYRCPWTESAPGMRAWKAGVDHLFDVDSKHENMCVCSALVTRNVTLAMHAYVKGRFGQTVQEYFLDPTHGKLGEYQMIGGFLEFVAPPDFDRYVVRHPRELAEPWPVKQFWSWDPKGPPVAEMERILRG